MKIILLLTILVISVKPIYDVPSYFGHFSGVYFNIQKIRTGTFKLFQYHFAVDLDSSNRTLYFADSKKHCIYMFNLTNNSKKVIAGTCGLSGDRVGDTGVMLMNNPMSVVFYQPNRQADQLQSNMKILIVANRSCQLTHIGCVLSDRQALYMKLTIDNLRPSIPLIQFPAIRQSQKKYLYISDTNNHCIKMIDIYLQSSIVVAGQCGVSGFTDGPYGYNRLNKPTSLGITRSGTLYFYDQGNQYMRRLTPNGQVSTLLNGACKQFGKSRQINGYVLKNILCYDNWIQLKTKAPQQHVIDQVSINFCTEHSSNC